MPAAFVRTRERKSSTDNKPHDIRQSCPLLKCQSLTWGTGSLVGRLPGPGASLRCLARAGVQAVLSEGASRRFPAVGLGRDRGLDPRTAGPKGGIKGLTSCGRQEG